jgi:hypothetical protein
MRMLGSTRSSQPVHVVIFCELSHVVAVGSKVLGYLPGYLNEENYSSGGRFLLVGLTGARGDVAIGLVVVRTQNVVLDAISLHFQFWRRAVLIVSSALADPVNAAASGGTSTITAIPELSWGWGPL